jgi:hypothetical protein
MRIASARSRYAALQDAAFDQHDAPAQRNREAVIGCTLDCAAHARSKLLRSNMRGAACKAICKLTAMPDAQAPALSSRASGTHRKQAKTRLFVAFSVIG